MYLSPGVSGKEIDKGRHTCLGLWRAISGDPGADHFAANGRHGGPFISTRHVWIRTLRMYIHMYGVAFDA